MDRFVLPENLTGVDPADPRREWIDELPRTVAAVADRWELRLGMPFQPGGNASWVAPATDGDGRDVVLKVGWTHDEAAHESDALRLWEGNGAVTLYDTYAFADTTALLLEACVPGTTLGRTLAEPDQDVVIAGLLRRMWRVRPNGGFRSLTSMCQAWADEFDEKLEAAGTSGMDPGLTRAGIGLFRELPTSADDSVLLCTDLHAGNVLAARREPWLVIDPKPYVGDPTYDVVQHMLNCQDRLEHDPVGFVQRMADLLDLRAERLRLWLFARSVWESIDHPWLGAVARRLDPT